MPGRPDDRAARRILDQEEFQSRVREEIARSLRTRRHLSVALLAIDAGTDRATAHSQATVPDLLPTVARHVARHIRGYDLVAAFGAAELVLLFPDATREEAEAILARLRTITVVLPRSVREVSLRGAWGIATWPADGGDPATLLGTARRRLSAMQAQPRA